MKISGFERQTNVRHIGIIFLFQLRSYRHSWHASGCQILSKSAHPQYSYGVISIFKMAAAATKFYFLFGIWCYCLQKVSVNKQTKFVWIKQSAAEILLFPI